MTEQEWLGCTDPSLMLEFLGNNASERKLRLFACACCRRVWSFLQWEVSRTAVEFAELYADGIISKEQLLKVRKTAARLVSKLQIEAEEGQGCTPYAPVAAATAAAEAAAMKPDAWFSAMSVFASQARFAVKFSPLASINVNGSEKHWNEAGWEAEAKEGACQSVLLRDIFGPCAFRFVSVDSSWRVYQNHMIPRLAQGIYDERAFEQLPILADALEDAGCTEHSILAHLRGPGPHVRGCWAVDLILGKS